MVNYKQKRFVRFEPVIPKKFGQQDVDPPVAEQTQKPLQTLNGFLKVYMMVLFLGYETSDQQIYPDYAPGPVLVVVLCNASGLEALPT